MSSGTVVHRRGHTPHVRRFDSIRDLYEQAESDDACEDGLSFVEDCSSVEEAAQSIETADRLFCLGRGYIQFAEIPPTGGWGEYDDEDLYDILFTVYHYGSPEVMVALVKSMSGIRVTPDLRSGALRHFPEILAELEARC